MLAERLSEYRVRHPVVLGIPRGGVVIADTVASDLNADLDIVLTRKLGAPGNPELAIGAVSESGQVFVRREMAHYVGANEDYVAREQARQVEEIRVRRDRYRPVLAKVPLHERIVIVVDDGVATGATMLASVWTTRAEGAAEVIVAVPVGARDAIDMLKAEADDVICLLIPEYFYAIGQFFIHFGQVEDGEVMEILRMHGAKQSSRAE